MGSHSATCHSTQVNVSRLIPAMQAGTRLTYPGEMEGWVDLVDLIAPRPGVEPETFRSRVRRRTAAPPRQPGSGERVVPVDGYEISSTQCRVLCIVIAKNYLWPETGTEWGLVDPLGAKNCKTHGNWKFSRGSTSPTPTVSTRSGMTLDDPEGPVYVKIRFCTNISMALWRNYFRGGPQKTNV